MIRPALATVGVLALNVGAFIAPLIAGAGAVLLVGAVGRELIRELIG